MTDRETEILLDVRDLQGGYGQIPVLHGVSLSVAEDEVVGLLGHNGMGKTTLLKSLMGFLPVTGGTVAFDGQDVTRLAPHRRARLGLAYVPQGRGILGPLSVRDNLRFAWSKDVGDDNADQAIDRVLTHFPRLERLLDRLGGNLSGGEQQLLALARCLMADPVMILLDEPTEGIQPSIIDEMVETLNRLRRDNGLTLLVVEQNLDFLRGVCDRLLVMERGAIKGALAADEMGSEALIDEFVGFGTARSTRTDPKAVKTAPATGRPAAPAVSASPASAGSAPANDIHQTIREVYMTIRRPTLQQMRDLTSGLGMTMSDTELQEYMDLMEGTFTAYDRLDALPDFLPEVKYPRTPGYRPGASENPLNAWYVKCDVKGASAGPLAGRKIALKDNICLAGVPMMNGASTLEGYTPDIDATVATRLLDAGATIVGKAHCEYYCLSGGSHTNATGPVHNPYKLGYIAGGSSSGSGALVGSGELDIAIGGDQGGSIRIPASFCGAYGMKPTHGLVPYTGAMPIENTIDHLGPITGNVADNALVLEVLAGPDGLDPRQYAPRVDRYTSALGRGVQGLRIGVVREGFGMEGAEADVDASVRAGAERLAKMGAEVEEFSLPMHLDGHAIWTPIALEGLTQQMMHGNGMGTGWEGLYTTSLLDYHSNWRNRADELSASLKISMFVGEYMLKNYRGHFYGKAQNLSRQLRGAYDDALRKYDLLLMPTLPMKAQPIPAPDASISEIVQRAFEMVPNTAPFDATGHPAMSIPCGMGDGLPIGLMLVGRFWDEMTIYRAADAFEKSGDWRTF